MGDDIDDIVVASIGEYDKTPLKAINKAGALSDLKSDEDKAKEEAKKPVAEKIRKALGDRVKDVVISSRLTDTPAAVILSDDDPSVQMQRLMKQMGGEMPEVKPMLEINPDSPVIARIEKSDDEDFIAALSAVILDQALIQEGVMPSDPASFAAALTKLLSE